MTAGEAIRRSDALRPNQYSTEQKLRWLETLEGQIRRELYETHETPEGQALPEEGAVTQDTVLLAPFPYDGELYTAFLFTQIDLHNAEIGKYNQSAALLASAWRQLADHVNRTRAPRGRRALRL